MIALRDRGDALLLFSRWLDEHQPPAGGQPYRARFTFEVIVTEKGTEIVVDLGERIVSGGPLLTVADDPVAR